MIHLKNIIITKDNKTIIDGISFSIQKGHIHYLMGPNGSGKSTLALAIMGYPEYEVQGEILFENSDIISLSPDKRARLGIFLSMQYPPSIRGVTILSLIKNAYQAIHGAVNVLEFRNLVLTEAKRLGLDESILTRGVNEGFSGGERKRLELLQLILLKPKLALLDEPDSGVDIDALKILSQELEHLSQQGMTLCIITHHGQLQLKPNVITVINQGIIVAEGGEELLQQIQQKGFQEQIL